jgi:hypothetical protein
LIDNLKDCPIGTNDANVDEEEFQQARLLIAICERDAIHTLIDNLNDCLIETNDAKKIDGINVKIQSLEGRLKTIKDEIYTYK